MTWIRTIQEPEATGELKAVYDEILQRTGAERVLDSRKAMSLRPGLLRAADQLALQNSKGETTLGRFREELIALVVSARLECTL